MADRAQNQRYITTLRARPMAAVTFPTHCKPHGVLPHSYIYHHYQSSSYLLLTFIFSLSIFSSSFFLSSGRNCRRQRKRGACQHVCYGSDTPARARVGHPCVEDGRDRLPRWAVVPLIIYAIIAQQNVSLYLLDFIYSILWVVNIHLGPLPIETDGTSSKKTLC
jgi:hypothetical protein